MEILKNLTTAALIRGHQAPDGSCVIVSYIGALSDIAPGDLLEAPCGQKLAIIDRWHTPTVYAQHNTALAIPLDSLAVIRRDGETVAEAVQVNAATIGDSPQLRELLTSSTGPTTLLGRAAKLHDTLTEALALLDDRDQGLHESILDHIAQHDRAYQVLLRDGAGVAIGDEISTADGLATIERLDRSTWPGLAILTCSSVEAQPGILRRLADKVTS